MIKEKWYIRLLKRIGFIKEVEVSKAEMCKAAQNICNHNCDYCAWYEEEKE